MKNIKGVINNKLFSMTRNLSLDVMSSQYKFYDPKSLIESLLKRKSSTSHNLRLDLTVDDVKKYIDYVIKTDYRIDIRFQKNVLSTNDPVYNSIVSYLDSTAPYDFFSVRDSIAINNEKIKNTSSKIGIWTYDLDAYDFYDIRLIINTGLLSNPILSLFINVKDQSNG